MNKVHLLVSELYIYQTARCNDKKSLEMLLNIRIGTLNTGRNFSISSTGVWNSFRVLTVHCITPINVEALKGATWNKHAAMDRTN
jgi:hypothetical protein